MRNILLMEYYAYITVAMAQALSDFCCEHDDDYDLILEIEKSSGIKHVDTRSGGAK